MYICYKGRRFSPNPAKFTDSRARRYIERFGTESWELDALSPQTIAKVIAEAVEMRLDPRAWNKSLEREKSERETLRELIDQL